MVDDFHILIDCGSVGGIGHLKAAVDDLQTMLPDAGDGKKRLDLLVVTHEHKDHIAGFDPELFRRIKIDNIWMNAAMDPEHPQAERSTATARLGHDCDAQHREHEYRLELRSCRTSSRSTGSTMTAQWRRCARPFPKAMALHRIMFTQE